MKTILLFVIALGLIGLGITIDRMLIHLRRGPLRVPVNPPPADLPEISEELNRLLDLYIKEWQTIVQTQMHFNDLILRFRSITLTVFLTLVGAALTIHRLSTLDTSTFLMIVGCIVVFWITAFILDFGYYHRLLLGSVAQAMKFDESQSLRNLGLFGMTTSISEHVHPPTSRVLVCVYYFLPLAVICGLVYWTVY